jgi:L-ascorbate metabolism protein UlaG (beta-lactamase superfamily)
MRQHLIRDWASDIFQRDSATFARLSTEARSRVAAEDQPRDLAVTFLGVSSLLFDDGDTQILTDGFFSRPNLLQVRFGRIKPNLRRIARAMRAAKIGKLGAIFVAHSHYDHALDSSEIAARTGATVYGSRSTEQLTIGAGLNPGQFKEVSADSTKIGRFVVRAIPSAHSPNDRAAGSIDRPLVPPSKMTEWKTGDSYSFVIEHDGRVILVHASAGFIPKALQNVSAETVYLGIGVLGEQSDEFKEAYWREVVEAVGAAVIVPIHWDNFARSLDRPLRPWPKQFDNVVEAMEFLSRKCSGANIELRLPLKFVATSPWS